MAAEDTRPFAFSAYNGQQFGLFCQRMIRDRKYKYIWNAADTDECYDLQNDPHEMYNLAFGNESSALCREYRHRLYDVFAGLKDPLVSGLWTERWLSGK
jgi:arylsulfatase A-like enzyme